MTNYNDNNQPKKGNNRLIKKFAASIYSVENEEDLISTIQKASSNEVIDKTSKNMMLGVLKISSLDVSDTMITHSKIESVDLSMSVEEILEKTVISTHTRFPVYCENKTEIIGILHVKDLLKIIFSTQTYTQSQLSLADIQKILRPAIFIPETKKLNLMLKDFKNSQNHLAMVVDEYGEISGLITIENILEEIVGDIDDEFDTIDENITKISDNEFIVDATTPIEDINEYFEIAIDDENKFDTVAGMIIQTLEYLPKKGDSIVLDGFKFTVNDADNRKIITVLVEKFKM